MIKRLTIIAILNILSLSLLSKNNDKWSLEKANAWFAEQGWIVGCNYVPSTAINQIEMWQESTFDPQTIDRELAMAEYLGFNTVRVFLSHLVYFDNAKGFKTRFSTFLDICESHHIKVIVSFWTNGGKCFNPKFNIAHHFM